MLIPLEEILVLGLGIWYIVHSFIHLDGPAQIFLHIRIFFSQRTHQGPGSIHALLHCIFCLSFWVALPICLYRGYGIYSTFAVAGVSSLIEGFAEQILKITHEE